MRHGIEHVHVNEQPELRRIVEMVLEEFDDVLSLASQTWKSRGAITKIILYGSHARGDWTDEHYTHVGKHSDWDLILIVNEERLTDRIRFWGNVTERLYREYRFTHRLRSPVHFFVYTIDQINQSLVSGRYFFQDILRDGVVIHETDDAGFIEPKPLSRELALKMSEEYFEDWFESSLEFFDDYNSNVSRNRWKKAAFELHQCVERLYHTVLLVYTLYTPHNHNVVDLRSSAELHDESLISAWPRDEEFHVAAFEKLQQAYVKARYIKDFHITEAQVRWLGEQTAELIPLIKASCERHLASLRGQIGTG